MTLRQATEILRQAGVENPAGDAGLLLTEYCGVSRAALPFSADVEYDSAEFEDAVKRRANREPLQYIIGKWWFRDLEFSVSPDCLIPRPETEMLVEIGLEALPRGGRVLDLCTGSGCVGLSVLYESSDTTAVLADISEAALSMARTNCDKLGLADRCGIVHCDVTKSVPAELADKKFDVILADEMKWLEPELSFEPEIALTDGGDGMSVVRGILEHYPKLLKDGGVLAIEIGFGEGGAAIDAAKKVGLSCEIVKDLSGLDRVLMCRNR